MQRCKEWHKAIKNWSSGLDTRICQSQLCYLIYLALTVYEGVSIRPSVRQIVTPSLRSVLGGGASNGDHLIFIVFFFVFTTLWIQINCRFLFLNP